MKRLQQNGVHIFKWKCNGLPYNTSPRHTNTNVEHENNLRTVKPISCTLVDNKIVDPSDVVGASPAGAAPTTSSFSTKHLASIDWVKTSTRQDDKHLSLGIWCDLYQMFYGTWQKSYAYIMETLQPHSKRHWLSRKSDIGKTCPTILRATRWVQKGNAVFVTACIHYLGLRSDMFVLNCPSSI